MPKLFISTPCFDAMMTMQYTLSLMRLMQLLQKCNIEYAVDFIGNESLIPRARNNSLSRFIQSDFTHLLFIDSDIEFPAESVLELLKFDKDVVCGSYPKKGYNWKRFIHSLQTEPDSKESFDSRGLDFNYNIIYDDKNELIRDGDFIRVNHAATGFMMIKREIIHKLCEKHTELDIISDSMSNSGGSIKGLFCCMIKNKVYLSEDYSFCERVNDIGGEVWISTSIKLNHIGKHSFQSDISNRKQLIRTTAEKQFY